MARTTYEHDRITALEIDGRPVEIASAELARISMLDSDDEVVHREWEVSGRTQAEIDAGVHQLVMTVRGRKLTQKGIFRESHADGWTLFKVAGLDELPPLD
jgi:hypothetical protein